MNSWLAGACFRMCAGSQVTAAHSFLAWYFFVSGPVHWSPLVLTYTIAWRVVCLIMGRLKYFLGKYLWKVQISPLCSLFLCYFSVPDCIKEIKQAVGRFPLKEILLKILYNWVSLKDRVFHKGSKNSNSESGTCGENKPAWGWGLSITPEARRRTPEDECGGSGSTLGSPGWRTWGGLQWLHREVPGHFDF